MAPSNLGTVFSMTPAGVLTTLAELTGGGDLHRGSLPYAGLIEGGDGFLYGTTSRGGFSDLGTVLRVSLADQSVDTLIEFTGKAGFARGALPMGALVKASDGNLYGTTSQGGATGDGTIFSIAADGTFKPVVQFTGTGSRNKGSAPFAALVQAADGNLYGTTARGGSADDGTVFRLTLAGALTTIAQFTGTTGAVRGALPEAPLVAAADGTLFGTTFSGGTANLGTVFKITSGHVLPVLDFTGVAGLRHGASPQSGLTLAPSGDFYGTTFNGGVANAGTLFRLTTAGALTTLAEFSSVNLASFAQPGVILGTDGEIHGITSASGLAGKGSIFQISFTGEFTTLAEFTGQGTAIPALCPALRSSRGPMASTAPPRKAARLISAPFSRSTRPVSSPRSPNSPATAPLTKAPRPAPRSSAMARGTSSAPPPRVAPRIWAPFSSSRPMAPSRAPRVHRQRRHG